jgi:CRISPR-associated protein Cas5t
MRALKIVAEGLTTSFRYPHFVQGVHPTFRMPPPATIYGHICSAVGDYIDPRRTRFAYHFQYEAEFSDYEHLHFFGKEAKMNPFRRAQLFRPRLTLYLDDLSLEGAFRSPRYPVALGRAQDLMTYTHVQVVELTEAERAYFDGTLLSLADAPFIGGRFYAVTMPRFLDERREAEWGQYAILPHSDKPPVYPPLNGFNVGSPSFDLLVDAEEKIAYPADTYRGVVWHTWT